MPMIPDDELDKMKRSIDLAAVIRARGVELKPQGHDLVGLCPFHGDKNPSLQSRPRKGSGVASRATRRACAHVQS